MILQDNGSSAVQTGGLVAPVKQFSIMATAKAFSILSSGLYTDKIKAVIRELSCNAWDAHVSSKNTDKPFEIHLPNSFEPFFRVSDFGPGLDEKDVYELYTTYFQSTKTDSNDYVGALGLGSKSPFSYTQSFTVTSRFGGMKKIYSAFLTDEGMPSIVKMDEAEYTGPNGLDVQIAVKSNDFYSFSNKAAEVFEYFPVVPTISGAKINVPRPHYSTKGTGWAIRLGGGQARAIQGTVAYPIPATNDPQADELLGLGMDLFFEIGDLEVAASREALSMNKATSKNLADRVKLVAAEVGMEVTKTIADAPTYWEAVKLFNELMKNGSVRYALKSSKIEWRGRKMQDYFDIKVSSTPTLKLYACERRSYGRSLVKEIGVSYITPGEFTLVRNDLKRGSRGVLTRWVKEKGTPNMKYFMVTPDNASFDTAEADADLFFTETLGSPSTILLLSAMKEELPKAPRGMGRCVRNAFQTLGNGYKWSDVWSDATDEDLEGETFFYIPTYRNQPGTAEGSGPEQHITDSQSLRKVKNLLVKMGVMDAEDPIFSGSPRLMAELKKLEAEEQAKWINIVDWAIEALKITDAEKAEIATAVSLNFYAAGFRQPDNRDTIDTVMQKLGITTANETIPALAEIKAAYVQHFRVTPIFTKYALKNELSALLGLGQHFRFPGQQEVNRPNLKKALKEFDLLDAAFGHYSNSFSSQKQAVTLITTLHNAKLI
jgi:hypothetical protein